MLAINNWNFVSIGISPFFASYRYYIDVLSLIRLKEKLRTTAWFPIAAGEAFMGWLREAIKLAQAAMVSV